MRQASFSQACFLAAMVWRPLSWPAVTFFSRRSCLATFAFRRFKDASLKLLSRSCTVTLRSSRVRKRDSKSAFAASSSPVLILKRAFAICCWANLGFECSSKNCESVGSPNIFVDHINACSWSAAPFRSRSNSIDRKLIFELLGIQLVEWR